MTGCDEMADSDPQSEQSTLVGVAGTVVGTMAGAAVGAGIALAFVIGAVLGGPYENDRNDDQGV